MDSDDKPLKLGETLMTRLNILTFSCEGKTVHVNKDVFLNACPNFQGLVSGSSHEARQKTIELTQIPYDAFNCLIQFVNTGLLDVENWTCSQWKSAITLAHEYQWQQFLQKLIEVLPLIEYSCKSIFDIIHVAQERDIKELFEKCLYTLDLSGSRLVADRSLFSELPEKIVFDLVARDTFYADEHKLLEAVIEWLNVHPAADPKPLFEKIRWELININLLDKAAPLRAMFIGQAPKHGRSLQPLTFKQACLPNANLAALFLPPDSKLLAIGENYFNLVCHRTWEILIKFPRPFHMNTICFKLFGSKKYSIQLRVYLSGRATRLPPTTASSWQAIRFQDQLVDRVELYSSIPLSLNSFECMAIPKVFATDSLVARKNMVAAPDFPFGGSSSRLNRDAIDFTLKQPCCVETVALYLEQFENEWTVDLADQRGVKLSYVTLNRGQLGHFIVLVFRFDRCCLSAINVAGRYVIANLMHVECPAPVTRLNEHK